MTDLDKAREEYEQAAWTLEHKVTDTVLGSNALAAADALIAALEAENEALRREVEALKCCPNCGHMTDYNAGSDEEFTECHLVRAIPDRETRSDWDYMDGCCHFTPSRWERREP